VVVEFPQLEQVIHLLQVLLKDFQVELVEVVVHLVQIELVVAAVELQL
tara:strand:- start:235 stop:378 length:144 start_codon:yes stop_codon:yes gene_type:complete